MQETNRLSIDTLHNEIDAVKSIMVEKQDFQILQVAVKKLKDKTSEGFAKVKESMSNLKELADTKANGSPSPSPVPRQQSNISP